MRPTPALPLASRVLAVARGEQGFGLIETIVALFVLAIALSALAAAFASSAVSLTRTSRIGAATALAEQQMELYRGTSYCQIALNGTAGIPAGIDSTYTGDPAYTIGGTTSRVTTDQTNSICSTAPGTANCQTGSLRTGTLNSCTASQPSVTGPNGIAYRIDTYVVLAPTGDTDTANGNGNANGRDFKKVTVVARSLTAPAISSRQVSTFDCSTGFYDSSVC